MGLLPVSRWKSIDEEWLNYEAYAVHKEQKKDA